MKAFAKTPVQLVAATRFLARPGNSSSGTTSIRAKAYFKEGGLEFPELMMTSPQANHQTVFLVSCVHEKLAQPAPARELYRSAWFLKARRYVEARGDGSFSPRC
jgi:hypothetical protein